MGLLDLIRPRDRVTRFVVVGDDYVSGMTASQLYETQPALRAVISFLADNVAGLPLKCYKRQPDGGRVRDRDSQLARVLARPNAWSTGHELIRATVSEYLLHDDALWLTIPDNRPEGWTIAVIPHDWVSTTTRDGLSSDDITVRTPYGGYAELSEGDYIRFNGWSPYGSASCSTRIEALKQILGEQVNAWKFRNGVWKNGGTVTQWISRPKDTPWSDGAKERFVESWKAKFAGDGTDTGGTPLLEDGMRLESFGFNAREAQWAEATKLSREDVCAVYHVNPGLVYHTDAQTYASAKDNARALYSDTLAPLLDFLEERMTAFLIPMFGMDSTYYCEFDLDAKLQGSFEERASVMQSSVGAPWMTRNEARAFLNLPAIDGGDELVTPLNVLVGGQASPNDVDGVYTGYNAFQGAMVKSEPVRFKSAPEDADAREITRALRKFHKRQQASVTQRIGAKSDNFPGWWDSERWNRELAEDLTPIFQRQANRRGNLIADQAFGGGYDEERTEAYIQAMAKGKAKAINDVTYRQLRRAIDLEDEDADEDVMRDSVSGVFELASGQRAETSGRSFATAVAGFAILEACRQRGGGRTITKEWVVTSGNPRPEHAVMDGETVPYDAEFSNGAKFPGDQVLTPEESCNCECQVEIVIQ